MTRRVDTIDRWARTYLAKACSKHFHSFGIDTKHVGLVDNAPTGVAPIFVEASGQNRIVVVKGENGHLLLKDIDAAAADLRGMQTIILRFEVPLETVYHTVRFASQHNIRCIVNPAPALAASLSHLTAADYFIPNETEAALMTGLPVQTFQNFALV